MKKKRVERVTPNKGQEEALLQMKKFIKSKSKDIEFCLDGSGGTGKTTIIKELFIKENKKVKGDFYVATNVVGIAVSHKARLVLSEHLPNSITYASAVNMTVEFDRWGEMIFVPKTGIYQQNKIAKYRYIVFDEASMVSDDMRAILLRCVSDKAKIIYMGDHCQLPPIKPSAGEYDPDKDSSVFELKNHYTLTEKMRQNEDDHIAKLCDLTREHIDSDKDLSWISKIEPLYNKKEKKGYSFTNEENVIRSFVRNFKDGVDCRIMAYRNARVDHLNARVRHAIFGDKASEKYLPGDLIVGNEQYAPDQLNNPIFFNGEDMIIQNVYDAVVEDLYCYEIWVEDKDKPLYVVKEESMREYYRKLSTLKAEALATKFWSEYVIFRSTFANISHGYAITLYKIQGTTLYGAYVDVSDIMSINVLSNKRKLQSFYVGISRPTNFLALF